MSQSILVVGGAGYVGSHTVLKLLQKGLNVTVIDIVDETCVCQKPATIRKLERLTGKEINYYNCNIQDEESLNDVFDSERITCVIHLASIKNTTKNPLQFYQNDVSGTLCLLETMKRHGVKKIIFSSTVLVYSHVDQLPITETQETGFKLPNVFAKTKFLIEETLKDLCKSDNAWSAIVLRHINPTGAHESALIGEPRTKNHIATIARHIVFKHDKIRISRKEYESFHGEGLADYLHVCDVAEAYALAVAKQTTLIGAFKVYNLAAGRPRTFIDALEKMSVLSGGAVTYEVVEEGECQAGFYVCGKLAEMELDWRAEKDLNDICRDTLRWVRANASGLDAIALKSDVVII